MCCSVLQCGAVCCSVLQCVAVCCSVTVWCSELLSVAVCYSVIYICTHTIASYHATHRVHNALITHHTATHCNALQHTATHCNTLQYTVTLWNTLQRTAIHCNSLQYTGTHCNTLQHIATHCNALQYTAMHCNTLQHTATHCNTLQHTATHCNTLQHTATHCNTLQHTATHTVWMLPLALAGASAGPAYVRDTDISSWYVDVRYSCEFVRYSNEFVRHWYEFVICYPLAGASAGSTYVRGIYIMSVCDMSMRVRGKIWVRDIQIWVRVALLFGRRVSRACASSWCLHYITLGYVDVSSWETVSLWETDMSSCNLNLWQARQQGLNMFVVFTSYKFARYWYEFVRDCEFVRDWVREILPLAFTCMACMCLHDARYHVDVSSWENVSLWYTNMSSCSVTLWQWGEISRNVHAWVRGILCVVYCVSSWDVALGFDRRVSRACMCVGADIVVFWCVSSWNANASSWDVADARALSPKLSLKSLTTPHINMSQIHQQVTRDVLLCEFVQR